MVEISQEYSYQKALELERAREHKRWFVSTTKELGWTKVLRNVENSKITILFRIIVILAMTGDLLGFIPVVGNFLNGFFAVVVFVLYIFNGLGKGMIKSGTKKIIKKQTRKWVRRAICGTASGLPVVGMFPWLTLDAFIEYVLTKKSFQKHMKKMEEIKRQLKPFVN